VFGFIKLSFKKKKKKKKSIHKEEIFPQYSIIYHFIVHHISEMDSESTKHLVEELHPRPHKSISEKERESDCPEHLVEELH